MTDIADKLREARALIEDPRCWTQGRQVRYDSRVPGKYRYCAVGACAKIAYGELFNKPIHGGKMPSMVRDCDRMRKLLDNCTETRGNIVELNDTSYRPRQTVHKEVLEAFDCAIEKAEENEAPSRL